MRKSGILMPVSALPSSTGVGELGSAAWHCLIPPAQGMNCISVWNC